MTNKEKAAHILAIIMEELNMPKGSTLGDIVFALNTIDAYDEVIGLLRPVLRDAVIDEIKQKTA